MPNHVNFYASQDFPDVNGSWSVYREEYAPDNLDVPLEDTVGQWVSRHPTEVAAHAEAARLYEATGGKAETFTHAVDADGDVWGLNPETDLWMPVTIRGTYYDFSRGRGLPHLRGVDHPPCGTHEGPINAPAPSPPTMAEQVAALWASKGGWIPGSAKAELEAILGIALQDADPSIWGRDVNNRFD